MGWELARMFWVRWLSLWALRLGDVGVVWKRGEGKRRWVEDMHRVEGGLDGAKVVGRVILRSR